MSVARKAAVFLAVAAVAHLATVATLPQLINRYVLGRLAAQAGGYNIAVAAPRADATARWVVRPSPDLLYTICVFDVSQQPLRVTAPVQGSYVSVSGFDMDTNNFFAINDAELAPGPDGSKRFDLLVARAGAPDAPPGAIAAPSARGLILFRSLITDEAQLEELQRTYQAHQRCTPEKSSDPFSRGAR
jgi:uncharacterized membrane protein